MKKIIAVLLLCFMLTSCYDGKVASEETQKKTELEFQNPEVLREPENAEEYLFFDGIELGTKYAEMGKAINPEGIFGGLAYDDWDDTKSANYPGSVSDNISSAARTSENDTVTGELHFGRHDYFDGISLLGVDVILTMDETQPDMDEFIVKKDEMYRDFIAELNISVMEKLTEEDELSSMAPYREGYLSEGYESEYLEGYVYDDTQTRTKYYYVAAYYTKDNPNKAKGEDKVIPQITVSKSRYPQTYSLENQ